jgi:ATP adenylyltransferase
MDRLWAPWRLSYVAAAKPPAAQDPCFICEGLAASDDRANLIAARRRHSVVILNRFPYNNGHVLVAPKAHKSKLAELTADESLEMQTILAELVGVYDRLIRPEGYNIGLNLGKVAGAGLPGHVHWHLVPRWNGDTNFMPVLTDTRVIVQSLESFYDLLSSAWKDPG